MSQLIRTHYDRFVLGLVTCTVAVSVGWFSKTQNEVRRIRALPVAVHPNGPAYKPSDSLKLQVAIEPWSKPDAQSGGIGWCYELFTPPTIFCDKSSGLLTVTTSASDLTDSNRAFGVELLEVKREPYRLQLTGYVGEAGVYSAILTGPDAGSILAKEGDWLEAAGVTLKSVSVQRLALEFEDVQQAREVVGLVELFDAKTGNTVTLDSRRRKFTDTLLATMRFGAADSAPRVVREGDIVGNAGDLYCIEHIRADPAEVVVSRVRHDTRVHETRTIHAVSSERAVTQSADSASISPRSATGIAINVR